MQHLLSTLPLGLVLFLISSLSSTARAEEEYSNAEIGGIPECANECALSFLQTQSCPLTTQACICAYLTYYTSCTARTCNTTSALSAAGASPVPYYMPSLTISIDSAANTSCVAVPAQNPVFGSKSSELQSSVTATSTSTTAGGEVVSGVAASASTGSTGERITIDTSSPPPTPNPTTPASQTPTRGSAFSATITIATSSPVSLSNSTQTERRTSTTSVATATTNSTSSGTTARITNAANAAERLRFRLEVQAGSTWALVLVLAVGAIGF